MADIVIIGSECSGKTSLAEALSQKLGIGFLPEASRYYAEEKDGILSYEDVMPIANMQISWEERFRSENPKGLRLYDTCILSTLIYSKIYYKQVPNSLINLIDTSLYDLFILTLPEPDWEDDGIRNLPVSRNEMHTRFKMALVNRHLNFIEVGGTLSKRIGTIENHLEEGEYLKF